MCEPERKRATMTLINRFDSTVSFGWRVVSIEGYHALIRYNVLFSASSGLHDGFYGVYMYRYMTDSTITTASTAIKYFNHFLKEQNPNNTLTDYHCPNDIDIEERMRAMDGTCKIMNACISSSMFPNGLMNAISVAYAKTWNICPVFVKKNLLFGTSTNEKWENVVPIIEKFLNEFCTKEVQVRPRRTPTILQDVCMDTPAVGNVVFNIITKDDVANCAIRVIYHKLIYAFPLTGQYLHGDDEQEKRPRHDWIAQRQAESQKRKAIIKYVSIAVLFVAVLAGQFAAYYNNVGTVPIHTGISVTALLLTITMILLVLYEVI